MFKLESYITPILLNYVAKYVKNIRDEDAQVSLWEGEATFQNLDLRLDVLEEELNLPVELVSGHIHELSIQVPWTKLTSEPVRIEINTIEFVAKLPNEETKSRRAEQRRMRKSTAENLDEQHTAAGAGGSTSGVVNKIINNINLRCHNIILKYVEDDIVVSMNVQYLNFCAADDKWKPAMVDVNPVSIFMRKLLQISDLTICLDKRNTAGRIEVCQEPVLYRCTMEIRVLRKYNVNTVSTSSTTRIGVFTKSLDVNVSSLQLPMVMRLIKMMMQMKPAATEEDIFNLSEPAESSNAAAPQQQQANNDVNNSLFTWAWNLLPSFEATPATGTAEEPIGHAFDVGVYAEELNFQLKNSELFTDQAMGGIKRIRYTPIMRISLGGIYYERSELKENDWANVRAGLSSILMEPLGVYRSDELIDRTLVNTKEFQNERAFIDKSLFDEQYMYADRAWCGNNHDDYFVRHTDEYMLYRSPVLAFDIVEYRAPQPLKKSVSPEAQLKDLGLRVKYRVLSAGITFHFSQSFLQVKNVINDLLRPYDYSGYYVEPENERKNINSPVSRQEEYRNEYMTYADFEYLIGFMPICNYKVDLRNMTVLFYAQQQAAEKSATDFLNPYRLSNTVHQSLLPYLQLKLGHAEGSICGPANPKRLVQLITHLQDKPKEVIDNCYDTYKFNVKNLTLSVLKTTPDQGTAKLVNIPSINVQFKRLLLPNLWRQNVAALETVEMHSELITLMFSKRELVLFNRLVYLIQNYDAAGLAAMANLVANANASSDVIKLQSLLTKVRINYLKYHTHLAYLFSMRNLNSDVYHSMMNIRNVVLSTHKGINNKWLELQLQLPRQDVAKDEDFLAEDAKDSPATAVCLWLEGYRLTLDIYLLQFLNSFDNIEACPEIEAESEFDAISQSEVRNSISSISMVSVPAIKSNMQPRRVSRTNSRKVFNPAETVHLSSERDEKPIKTADPAADISVDEEPRTANSSIDLISFVKRLSSMVVIVDMAKARIDVCEAKLRKENKSVEYTSIFVPRTKIKSGNGEDVARGNIRAIIQVIQNSELCNCVIELDNFNIGLRSGPTTTMILEPLKTTITLAVSEKRLEVAAPGLERKGNSNLDSLDLDTKVTESKKVDWVPNTEEEEQQQQSTYSINVHVDMSEIKFIAHRLKLLHEHYLIVAETIRSLQLLYAYNIKCEEINKNRTLEVYTGSADTYPIIREFLDLDPEYEPSSKTTEDTNTELSLIFFCQWTIPRISLIIESTFDRKQRRMVLNFEDLLLNVDRRADFTKVTTKVENVSLNYYEAKQGEWTQNDNIHIKMLGDHSTHLPLISVVVTTVNLQDLYTKIGARNLQNLNNKRNTISELLIEVQPIEVILHIDKINEFLISHSEVLELMCSELSKEQNSNPETKVKNSITTVKDLPIVHLNSKGIYVYVTLNPGPESKTETNYCSVLLLRIENIKLTPSVENPLVRQLIRQDIYNKAAELNMLSTPGSLVEDRQYELSVRKISLSTGDWNQTQKFRLEKTLTNEHSNPAFEWNNQTRSTELRHIDIFKDFDFIMIFAPAISFDRFLVCGEITEYNCATDFVASLNTLQIQLICFIQDRFRRMSRIVDEVCYKLATSGTKPKNSEFGLKQSSSFRMQTISQHNMEPVVNYMDVKSSDTFLGSCQSDSGIHLPKSVTDLEGPLYSQTEARDKFKFRYPRSVSFVAGMFALRIYEVLNIENDELILRPLLLVTINQPSFMVTETLTSTITQASLFNFNIHLAKTETERASRKSDFSLSNFSGQFSEPIFETLPGTLGSTGIPSPLLMIKTHRDRNHQLEMDVELRKPMLLRICDSSIRMLFSDFTSLYTLLSQTPYFSSMRSERPVLRTTPLRQLKLQCFNADRLHLVLDRLTVKFYADSKDFKCTAVFLDFNSNMKFSSRPQKASIKSVLGSFYLQTGNKVLLHPLSMRLSADLLSEPWCEQLLISATLKLNVLHIDASIANILHLRKARRGLNRILEHMSQEWSIFLHQRPSLGNPVKTNEAYSIYMPCQLQIVHSKVPQKPKAEFYQDDLRAGAFQFVYLSTDTMLPMPYQVQIIKKNYGIICWRYPQPRQMSKIHIYPVPMPVENPIHIKCRMEYFSETHETFLHYCDFDLSEVASNQLTPPERQISATIWRVVIMQSLISVDGTCFETDEDEEMHLIDSNRTQQDFKGKLDNDFILHPKVLVGCMRIDTIFQANLVPKLQLLVSCQDIEVNFLNQPEASNELPPPLKKYKLSSSSEITQTFLTIHVDNLQLYTAFNNRNNFSAELDFRSRIKCLDYGFLSMLDVMEPMNFRSYLLFNGEKRLLNANLIMDKLRLNCGPSVLHTLLGSKQHWQDLLQKPQRAQTLMPKCVIVNRMQTAITFGQSNTGERIKIQPQELRSYYFCSDYQSQELTFLMENNETNKMEASESLHISLKFEEEHLVRHLRIGKCCITIKQRKLSATQVYILIKGQIELVSMLPFELLTEFRAEGKQNEEQGQNALGYLLGAKGRSSFYHAVGRNEDVTMRLKLNAANGKGRTGDIPLKPNNSLPWLVKVPTQLPQQFISVWVRILREDIVCTNDNKEDFQPQRILVSIWPIFELCNLLSCQLRATETSTEEIFSIAGEGGRHALTTPTTHSTSHLVKFEYPGELGAASQNEFPLMLKSMDWHKFFYYDPTKWSIENTLHQLDKTPKPKWPLNDEEELRVHRPFRLTNKFDVQYRVQSTREFSCSLGLEIAAWGMFINATGLDISVYQPTSSERYQLRANSLEMLPLLSSHFTLDVPFGCGWVSSLPICLDQQMQTALSSSGNARNVLLRVDSFVDIVIVRNDDVLRLMLEHKLEDGRRVFKLRSKFVIANYTDVMLHALPLTMDHKENSNRNDVNSLDLSKNVRNPISDMASTTKEHSIGNTLELFNDLHARQIKHTSDTAFVYFVCFAVSGSQDISIPIPLAMPFTRRCFSLQHESESIPLMITLIEKDNVYYLNVFRDTAPAIIINNNTNIKFIVAQTSASGNSNVTCTTSEFAGKHFEWHQLVVPHSKCYYTPPQMYANFPDVEFTMCNLSLALYSEAAVSGKTKIGWSKPIRTDKSWHKFLHVPNHGDIKVVVCDKHRVIRLNIYYIAHQQEFSVKDLRSRLNKTDSQNSQESVLEHSNAISILDLESETSRVMPDCVHFEQECQTDLRIYLRMFIKSFVFSLQTNNRERDYLKTEVCNVYADDVMLAYNAGQSDKAEQEQRVLHVQLPNLQVDNQLYSSGKYDFPVLLCAQTLYKRNSCLPQVYNLDAVYRHQAERVPISLLTFSFYQDELQLQAVQCKLQPLRVYIEDAYLNQLLDTLVECEPSNCVYSPQIKGERLKLLEGQTLLPAQVVAQALYIAEPLRLNSFIVEPLSLLLSVHTSSRLYIALDHSPLSFSRYERQQVLTVPLRFGQSLGLHYLSGAIFGAGWVVGSLEILGSPSGLARSFSTGLRDFISMPVQGLFRGPWGFVVGITQGSASLLRNVTAGTVNSVTKLAGSVARNLDRLTLDSEHIELTEARRRARPQGFAEGLTQGLTGLGISLLGAVGGLAHHTLEARSSVGVLTGLTKGIVGALTKPISGAAEMVALTGQGMLHTVGFNAMPQQVDPTTTHNVSLHASSYRIWRYLPEQLSSDEILFFQEITLMLKGQMRSALLFLTTSVLGIIELESDDLTFISPVLKVELSTDREDASKLYLTLKPEQSDDLEGQLKYKNERIISFLNASRLHARNHDCLSDLLQLSEQDQDEPVDRQTQCIFYIKPNIGEHLIHYLRIIGQTQLA